VSYRIGILTTHPIQYQVPWFRALAEEPEIDLTVFYCMLPDARQQGSGFGVDFVWDIPLLNGYDYEVLHNIAPGPSGTSFRGCDTPEIDGAIRKGGFDAFIVSGWVVKSCLQALWACRKWRVPCIVRGESNCLRLRPWWVRSVHRLLLRQYSAFLTIGEANRAFYLRNGVSSAKLFAAPYCVENERFAAQAREWRPHREGIRQDWGIPASAFTFLFSGKFIPKKRPFDLLTAFSSAVRAPGASGSKTCLLMVGDGELRPACERIARREDLPVIFTGFLNQSEMPRAYVASDCLVLPSDNGETWGLVVNEAMACGLPAIVSDQVGCRLDLVESGRTGAVFPCGDSDALSELLVAFCRSPDGAKVLGDHARELIAGYSVRSVVAGTIEAVEYVCRRRRACPD